MRTRPRTGRAGATSGRWRRRATDAGQTALVLVVSFTLLLSLVGAVMVSLTLNNSPLLATANTQRYAYRALASGLNAYQSAINADPYLASCNALTNVGASKAQAQCAGISYGTWSLVPGTDIGGGVIPEFYKFDNPRQVKDPTTGALLYLEVQVVGSAGFGTRLTYYATQAKFVPANGFLDNLFWTNYQSQGSPPTNCYYWKSYNVPSGCTAINFFSNETLNGPVFANDSIYLGSSTDTPLFGSSTAKYGVTTADPRCLFRTSSSSATGCVSNFPAANYNASQSSFGPSNYEPIPSDNTELANYALRGGCYYQGPTTITLSGSTMNVISPDTPGYASGSNNPSTANYGSNANVCPTNGSGALPTNGVVFVDQATSAKSGANPFDGTGQTCSGKTPCAQTQAQCPGCYYGQTSTPDAEADAFVSGDLSGHLTIGAKNDIIITNDLTYDDCTWAGAASQSTCAYNSAVGTTPNDTLGLIAYNYVNINRPVVTTTNPSSGTVLGYCGQSGSLAPPLCNPANGASGGLVIDASILALQQSFVLNNNGVGANDGNLVIYGSIQQDYRGLVSTGGESHGYVKQYSWDPRLALYSPPFYLSPGTPSWALTSSAESYCGAQPLVPPVQATPSTTQPVFPGCNTTGSQVMSQAAFTADGCSGTYSAATSTWAACGWTTGAPSSALVPSAPSGVTATAADSSATVSWTAPSSNGGSPVTGYTVTASSGGGSCTTTGTTACTVTGLTNGTSYTFTVTATNAVGTGPASAASAAVTPIGAPGAPTSVTATAGVGNATVSWTAPGSNGGSSVLSYTATASPGGATCTISAPATSCTVSGLTAGTSYTFTVTATNAVGTGPASTPSAAVIPTGVPGAPTGVTAAIVSGTANGATSSLTVSWTAPASNGGSPITGYTVVSTPGGKTCSTATTSCTVSGLTTGTSYTFTVTATNAVGTGPASAASTGVTAITVPGVPTSLGGSSGTFGNPVTVLPSWTAPASTGSSPITSYTVTLYSNSTCTTSVTATQVTTSGTSLPNASSSPSATLKSGTKYYFKVYATNADGDGAASACYSTGITAQ